MLADSIDPIDHRATALAERAVLEATIKQSSVAFEACAREFHLAHAESWKDVRHAAQWIRPVPQLQFTARVLPCQNGSRNTFFMIFPAPDNGNASLKSTERGTL